MCVPTRLYLASGMYVQWFSSFYASTHSGACLEMKEKRCECFAQVVGHNSVWHCKKQMGHINLIISTIISLKSSRLLSQNLKQLVNNKNNKCGQINNQC